MQLRDLVLGATPLSRDRTTPALVTPQGTLTRADVRSEVEVLSGAITALAPTGGRIAIVSDNRPEVVALLLAIPLAGRVAVPINTRLTPDEVTAQLDASGARAVIGTAEELGRLAVAIERAATVETAVGIDARVGDISLSTLAAAPVTGTPAPPDTGDPAWILFTSGTTGPPKGVVLTTRSLGAAVATSAAARPLADDDTYLYPFPLYHVSAYNVLHALARSRPVVLPRRFDAAEVAALTEAHGVTVMSLAPTMLRVLLDHQQASDARLDGLRTIAYGAAPMPPALLAEAREALSAGFAQGYGMTELSGNAVFLSPDDHDRGLAGEERLLRAAGWPGPGVDVRTTDDDGHPVEPGEPGEVRIRGRQVCAGYWEDPEATAEAIQHGWLRTGDVGVLDHDGLLTIVDRVKDIIVTGGENVASREVEEVLARHPAVARVAVVGLPDDHWGEAVWAAVVPRPGITPGGGGAERGDDRVADLVADLTDHAAGSLAGFKVPKHIAVVESLPENAGGKVVKGELRRRLAAAHQGAAPRQ